MTPIKLPRRHSLHEYVLLLEAFVLLGFARLLLLTVPFKALAARLSHSRPESGPQDLASDGLAEISWAVNSAARWTPWDSACFARAVAARVMLDRRGLPSTIFLGMKRDDRGKVLAHAWLRSGEAILTGDAGHEEYAVLSSFSSGTAVRP